MSAVIAFALALLAGAAQALSIAFPADGQPLWWLQLLSLAVLARLLWNASWRRATLLGWAFATAWLTATFWWLFISMHVYGGLASGLSALAVLALAGFLALYYAAASGVFAAARGANAAMRALLFAALWLLAELLRATWFTGFPWGAGGYAHVDGPLAVLAPFVGVYGIGFVASLLAYAIALATSARTRRSWRYWAALLVSAGLLAACNIAAVPSGAAAAGAPPLSVALLQGNIPQDEKFEAGTGVPQALQWYGEQLHDNMASLVVAPETAIPLLPQQLPVGYLSALQERYSHGDQAALIGMPLGGMAQGYTNSAIGLKPGADLYRYDKHHLVPFGEFIPPLFRWFTDLMHIPLGDFNRGPLGQPSFDWKGQRLAPNICYEDLFGEEIGVHFRDAANAPTILVNMSNIGWFGDTVAIDQHLQISRMRAIEFHRPMIRATNTGATAIIDAGGHVLKLLPRMTRGVLTGQVQGQTDITVYARWVSRFGLWPVWILGLAIVAACSWLGRQRAY